MAKIPDAKFGVFPELDASAFIEAMAEAVRPVKLSTVALEAIEEVSKARQKHGSNADLADGTGPGERFFEDYGFEGEADLPNWEAEHIAKSVTDSACAAGRKHTRAQILFEEFVEAVATGRPEDLRKELIQVIAMGLDWIVDLDDRGDTDDIDQED